MLSSLGSILSILPLLASTFHAHPTTPADTIEISACDPSWAFHRPSNRCQPLLQQSVCEEGKWLVLNKSTKEPECRKRPCEESQLPLYSDPDICVPIYNPGKHCGLNQFLVADRFGFGHCECKNEPGYIYWPPDDNCYRVFHRGPCDPGNIFIFDSRNGTTVCKWNPCPDDQIYWLSLGECVSENDPTLCPPFMPLTYDRLPDHQFTLACLPLKQYFAIGSYTFRKCEPGSISEKQGKCGDEISFNLCPSGKEEDLFGGCRESSG
ncbi:unnamed protein product [Darwinula stevensoni]|uniref:DUF4789 domain-containing protein n=1 Tax=Darwinula stevensoni TaxID=69355 RepID=A0A7R9FNT9_9CRUS|nr:unnamed protein product [Darwinula stevensoni]CAG0896834.1 unnamed protein product [Darwinula stevensoni]